MTEVTSLKLSTSEELVARVVERKEDSIVLDRPLAIGLVQGPQGVSMQLIPFMASNQDGTITVFNNHIVAETVPAKELQDGYLNQTSAIDTQTSPTDLVT